MTTKHNVFAPITADMITIVEGRFANVGGGNCSRWWILDGDDVQERANALPGHDIDRDGRKYPSTIFERGVIGWALQIEGVDGVQVYLSRRAAEAARDRIVAMHRAEA